MVFFPPELEAVCFVVQFITRMGGFGCIFATFPFSSRPPAMHYLTFASKKLEAVQMILQTPVQRACFLWGLKSYPVFCRLLPASRWGHPPAIQYLWYCNSWLHIPPILLHYLYLLNVTGYKYPAHILSNPIPATENTNTGDRRGSESLLKLCIKSFKFF